MKPIIHLDPNKTAAFTAYKAASRLILAIAASTDQPLQSLYIKSAFPTVKYQHDRPFYVKHTILFSISICNPHRPNGKLHLNFFGTRTACFIFIEGLDNHLQQ